MRTLLPSTLLFIFFLLSVRPVMAQGYDCAAQSEVPVAECEALVALYTSTGGDNWTNNSGWLSDPVSGWYGVTVSGGGVTDILLANNSLSGAIPPELGQLSNLQSLFLSYNDLSGAIPPELGQLSNLETLELRGTSLSGAIPPELGQLSSLHFMYLSLNSLSGAIPPELGQLSNLLTLRLEANSLSGAIPPELGQLSNLVYLVLHQNSLSGAVPPELGQLSDLQFLFLYSNPLDGSLPLSLTNLTALNLFYFNDTGLCEPPDASFQAWLSGISDLQSTGTACSPEPAVELSSTSLDFGRVQVGSAADRTVTVTNTGEADLELDDVALDGDAAFQVQSGGSSGTLEPAAVRDVEISFQPQAEGASTATLTITSNAPGSPHVVSLSGTAQEEEPTVAEEDSLALVALYDATDGDNWTDNSGWLSDPVSGWYGVTVSGGGVTSLQLADNSLSGEIPPELGQLSSLQKMYLNQNSLSGTIPPELGQISSLQYLWLNGNPLSGAIPPELGQLSNLQELILAGHNLSGEIPPELGQLSNLRGLGLAFSDLSGTIPPELGQLSNLVYLVLPGNSLSGAIPPELGQLSNLQVLRLNSNPLEGALPQELTNLSVLNLFYFNDTGLCEPPDASFQAWLSGISDLQSTGTACSSNQPPTAQDDAATTEATTLVVIDVLANDSDPDGTLEPASVTVTTPPQNGNTSVESSTGQVMYTAQADFTGTDTFRYTVEDDVGAVSNEATVTVTVEIKAGEVSVVTGEEPEEGAEHDVTVSVDGFEPTTATLFYRQGGERSYQQRDLQTGAGSYLGAIPPGYVTPRGVDYYVWLSDGTTTATYPEESPEESPEHLRVRTAPMPAAGPFAAETYRMISVPLALDAPTLAEVLGDDLGAYNPAIWRLLRWNATRQAYDERTDLSGATFAPGTAYWLITRGGEPFDVDEGLSTDASEPYEVTLTPGWNQIATPFAFPVAWEAILTESGLGSAAVEAPVAYDGSPYQYDQSVLEPWQGYFVYNTTGDPVTLCVPPVEASGASSKTTAHPLLARADYALQLVADVAAYHWTDATNYLGFAAQAAAGRDALDLAEAPGIGDGVRLSILEAGERLAGSYKPTGAGGQAWEVEVATRAAGDLFGTRKRVKIALQEHGTRPPGFEIHVLDAETGALLPSEEGRVRVTLDPDRPVRRLRVVVGTEGFAADEAGGRLTPQSFRLVGNYPNPFNPETQIRYEITQGGHVTLAVYDVLGRRVRMLVDRSQEAGRYAVRWDGRDESGQPVSSGLYLYRLQAGTSTATRTMHLVK